MKFLALLKLGVTVATFLGREALGNALAFGSSKLEGRFGDKPLLLLPLSTSERLPPLPVKSDSTADFLARIASCLANCVNESEALDKGG